MQKTSRRLLAHKHFLSLALDDLHSLATKSTSNQLLSLRAFTSTHHISSEPSPATSNPSITTTDAIDDDIDISLPPTYLRLPNPITAPYSITPKHIFAIIELAGTQFKVTPDDIIITEKLKDVSVNDRLQLGRVLLLGSATQTIIGRPYVPGAIVTAAVEEQFLDGKVYIFKKRRRKNSQRSQGHRQQLTTIRITDIIGIEEGERLGGVDSSISNSDMEASTAV